MLVRVEGAGLRPVNTRAHGLAEGVLVPCLAF